MSNTVYLEIDSTYRNRNSFPNTSDFEIQVSQSGIRTRENALDSVCLSSPIVQWSGYRFNATTISDYVTVFVVPSNSLVWTRYACDNTNLLLRAYPNQLQKAKNYYLSATIMIAQPNSSPTTYLYRKIVYYEWLLLTTDSTYDYVRIVLSSPFPDSVVTFEGDGLEMYISDPTELYNITPQELFVPNGYSGLNCYYDLYIYNETQKDHRKIKNYDVSTNIVFLDSFASNWNKFDNYSIRKELPFVSPTNISYSNINSITVVENINSGFLSSESNYYNNDFIRIVPIEGQVYGRNQTAPTGEMSQIINYSVSSSFLLLFTEINYSALVSVVLPSAQDFATNGSMWVGVGFNVNTLAYSLSTTSEAAWVGLGEFIADIYAVTWVGSLNKFIFTGWSSLSAGSIGYSSNGINWTLVNNTSNIIDEGYDVIASGTTIVCVGYKGIGTSSIAWSNNGINWTGLGTTIFEFEGWSVATNNSIFVAVGFKSSTISNTIAYSTNGIAWTGLGNAIFTNSGRGCDWSSFYNRFVAVGGSYGPNTIAWSDDGINWTGLGTNIFSQYGQDVVWGSGVANKFVAVGRGTNTLAYSIDGKTWVGLGTSIFGYRGYSVCWNGFKFIANGTTDNVNFYNAYSYDGVNWTTNDKIRGSIIENVAFLPEINENIYMSVILDYPGNTGYYLIMTNSSGTIAKQYGPVPQGSTAIQYWSPDKWNTYSPLNNTGYNVEATFYGAPNYQTTEYVVSLTIGDYNWVEDYGIPNDSLSSIRVPPGLILTLFEDAWFEGNTIKLSADTPYLPTQNFNDLTSSIKIARTAGVLLASDNLVKTFTFKPLSAVPSNLSHKFEVLKWSYDNACDLSYSGPIITQPEMVCVELLNIVLPNKALNTQFGNPISSYPYIYVELSNVSSGGSALTNIIYSNNPNSSKMVFRACIIDINQPQNTSFIRLDGDKMVQKMKFQANNTMRFRVFLPNGQLFKVNDAEYFSPSEPNAKNQITALFAIKRV